MTTSISDARIGEGGSGIEEPVTALPTTGQRPAVETGIAGPLALFCLALACIVAARALRREGANRISCGERLLPGGVHLTQQSRHTRG